MDETRPDPDKLLKIVTADANRDARGHLKIFFAAAAGSGKTYAMLSEAHRKISEGVNVVAGVVEHHGRAETKALLEGIPVLPQKDVVHRGIALSEFDLDAALEMRPGLVLVDELAHTNVPGSRHPKRWQDVEELLGNGIDVYTTLNVQHLESVNDIVARLTGIWVKETVPDSVFEQADEIALIDIPSEELLKRLAEGKVYLAEGANVRAAESFFKKSNLIALRELALRRTAERVEQQSDALHSASGQPEAILGAKILVVVDKDPISSRLIRIGRRMAARAKAPFTVLYVISGKHDDDDEIEIAQMDQQIRLAETLGAGVVRLNSLQPDRDIVDFARRNGFSRIVLGYRRPALWRNWFGKPLSQKVIEHAGSIEIMIINADQPLKSEPAIAGRKLWNQLRERPRDYLSAVMIVAACTLLGLPIRGLINPYNLTMVFMTGVVFAAVRLGTAPSLLSAVLGIAAFNFFFIEPYYIFTAFDPGYYFTFGVMLITSVLGGALTGRLRDHSERARLREIEVGTLYDLARGLSSVRSIETIVDEVNAHVGAPFKVQVHLWVWQGKTFKAFPDRSEDLRERSAALWALENRQIAGRGTDTMPSAQGFYIPVLANDAVPGVVAFYPDDANRRFSTAEIQHFNTFVSLLAVALQRTRQAEDAALSRIEAENEKLRNALLASLSHDLRTPLTVMNGGLSVLLRMRKRLPREAMDEITALWIQLTDLQKFVGDLLRLAAITSGTVKIKKEPYLIPEILGAALERVEDLKDARTITTSLAGNVPIINVDGGLIEQVMINLLENAIRHTAADGEISVSVGLDADAVRIQVSDNGDGLQPGSEDLIFGRTQLADGAKADRQHNTGTGLGLVICRAIIQAHGGMIYARNNPPKETGRSGSSFIFTLPLMRVEP